MFSTYIIGWIQSLFMATRGITSIFFRRGPSRLFGSTSHHGSAFSSTLLCLEKQETFLRVGLSEKVLLLTINFTALKISNDDLECVFLSILHGPLSFLNILVIFASFAVNLLVTILCVSLFFLYMYMNASVAHLHVSIVLKLSSKPM